MKKIIFILFVSVHAFFSGMHTRSGLSLLRKECLHSAKQDKSQHTSAICYTFNAMNILYKSKAAAVEYVLHKDIKHIFEDELSVRSKGAGDQYLTHAQLLTVAQLYAVIFQEIIERSQNMLTDVIHVKAYWEKELFKHQYSAFYTYSFGLFGSDEYLEEVSTKVEALCLLEKQVSRLLGIASYGFDQFNGIDFLQSVEDALHTSVSPLYNLLEKTVPVEVEAMFYDQENILYALESEYACIDASLKDNNIPHYVMRHWCAYTCGTIGLLTTLLLYKTYEKEVCEYASQGKHALGNVKDYVVDSFWGLKEVLWDRKAQQVSQPKFEKFEFDETQKLIQIAPLEIAQADKVFNIPELSTEDLKRNSQSIKDNLHKAQSTRALIQKLIDDTNPGWLVKNFVAGSDPIAKDNAGAVVPTEEIDWKECQKKYLQNPHDNIEGFVQANIIMGLDEMIKLETFINDSMKNFEHVTAQELKILKARANQLTETADRLEAFAKKAMNVVGKNYDKKMLLVEEGVDIFNDLLKKQSVTIGLTAIVPVIVGSYALYKNGSYFYDRSYHHAYVKPMREIVREIDMLLNLVLHQTDRVFATDGKLYYLVTQLRDYVGCLESEELQKIIIDMQDLLSFDLSYVQKYKVIERMYHTYDFLV